MNAPLDGIDNATKDAEHFDVLVVGAGISGIGAAYHLSRECPGRSFVILEAQESFGGTWLTHRYPGARSDSDLYTYGYAFKPWTGPIIATAAEIRAYMAEVIEENGLGPHIRYRHQIKSASWSSKTNRWLVKATRTDTGETVAVSANFLWMCQGYYRHAEGYTPRWDGMEAFRGPVVHPQTWPEDLDLKGRNIVVIGSGATAATLVPAIAADSGHVTLLQRSPIYFSMEIEGAALAGELRALDIDKAWFHEIMRRKILRDHTIFTNRTFSEPEIVKQELIAAVRRQLGPDYDVETHFTPAYRPWRQRIAYVPEGDFFQTIRDGKTSVVTDHIDRFTETGILLRSGRVLEADIIVTSTGFNLSVFGDIDFSVDGDPVDFSRTVTYHGMMFTGVPNMAWVFGYFRSSWTPRVDMVGEFVCRLLRHMGQKGMGKVVPRLRPEEKDMPLLPWIDPENFNAGYLMRSLHLLPKRGDRPEWQHTQDYMIEKDRFPAIDLENGALVYA